MIFSSAITTSSENVRSWWEIRELPNMLMLHFAKLREDMPSVIRRIADFAGISINDSVFDKIVDHCSFAYMKNHATKSVPLGGAFWDGGATTFINQGTNGRWRDILSTAENARYEQMALDQLGKACAHWLTSGNYIET